MPIYEYRCDYCERKEELVQPFDAPRWYYCDSKPDGTDYRLCPGRMERQLSVPAPAQGDFGTPKRNSASNRMRKYVDDRLAGNIDSPYGAKIREQGFEPRPAAESGVTESLNPDA